MRRGERTDRKTEKGQQRERPPYVHENWIPYGLITVVRGKVKNCFHCLLDTVCVLEE